MWQKAAREGRVRWAALRAPDFYGPGVDRSHIGDTGLGLIAQGKAAQLLMRPDLPHAFAYVPDIARAAVSLLDAPRRRVQPGLARALRAHAHAAPAAADGRRRDRRRS